MHWTCISSQCEWSARQGHSATYFNGFVYIFGGFDESGYSNSVYKFPAIGEVENNGAEIVEDETNSDLSDSEIDKAGSHGSLEKHHNDLTTVFEKIEHLKLLRDSRDQLVREIIYVVGLVTRVFQFADFENRQRHSSVDLSEGDRINDKADENDILKIGHPEVVGLSSNEKTLPDFSMIGSPFRESALEKIRASGGKDIKNHSFVASENMELMFLQKLSSFSSINEQSTSTQQPVMPRSASLWDRIENDKQVILKLQAQIRSEAEAENLSALEQLILKRAEYARMAAPEVLKLLDHLDKMSRIYDDRQNDLNSAISKLEGIQENYSYQFGNEVNFLTDLVKETTKPWEYIVQRSSEIVHFGDHFDTEQAVSNLHENLLRISKISANLAMLLRSSQHAVVQDFEEFNMDAEKSTKNAKELAHIMFVKSSEQSRIAKLVEKTADYEVVELNKLQRELIELLRDGVLQGVKLIQSAHSQNTLASLEIAKLREDLVTWKESLILWDDVPSLRDRCDLMVKEVAALEEQLLNAETLRIDLKSAMEKALLQTSRAKLSRVASNEQIIMNDIEVIKADLLLAEKRSKQARKELRSWYRSNRNFGINIAPELFHFLPDFRSPGSVLGDGGFAQSANIPRRQLCEYDDVTPLITAPSAMDNATGRHLLLKALYDGQEVILKGFVMHNNEQRKGMDREIAILSKLKSDVIICPRAIVDASSDGADPTLQITLFIEYPFYKGGNLSTWLKAADERKPWELQSISRQILYGLMYLHDHGVVHKDIKPSNILLREDGRIVLTDFELSRVVEHVSGEEEDDFGTVSRSGTKGFMAPEVNLTC